MGRFDHKSESWRNREKVLFGNLLEMSAWAKTLTEEEKVIENLLTDEEEREVQGIKSHFSTILDTEKEVDPDKFFSFIEDLDEEQIERTRHYTHKLNDRMMELTNNIRDRKFGLDITPSHFGLSYSEVEEIVENHTSPIVSSINDIESKVDRNYREIQSIEFGDTSVKLTDEDLNYLEENIEVDTGYDEILELIDNRFNEYHGDFLEIAIQYQDQLDRIERQIGDEHEKTRNNATSEHETTRDEMHTRFDELEQNTCQPEPAPEPDDNGNDRNDTYGEGIANKIDEDKRGSLRDLGLAGSALFSYAAAATGVGSLGILTYLAGDVLSDGELDGNFSNNGEGNNTGNGNGGAVNGSGDHTTDYNPSTGRIGMSDTQMQDFADYLENEGYNNYSKEVDSLAEDAGVSETQLNVWKWNSGNPQIQTAIDNEGKPFATVDVPKEMFELVDEYTE